MVTILDNGAANQIDRMIQFIEGHGFTAYRYTIDDKVMICGHMLVFTGEDWTEEIEYINPTWKEVKQWLGY